MRNMIALNAWILQDYRYTHALPFLGGLEHYFTFLSYILHYSDVAMSAMVSQITRFTIVDSTVYSGADQRKHQSSATLIFVRGIPAQRASNAENVIN